jgi:hypothetical protein
VQTSDVVLRKEKGSLILEALDLKQKLKGSVVWERVRCGKRGCHRKSNRSHPNSGGGEVFPFGWVKSPATFLFFVCFVDASVCQTILGIQNSPCDAKISVETSPAKPPFFYFEAYRPSGLAL